MLAPSEQANVKKTPTTAYIISVYKVFTCPGVFKMSCHSKLIFHRCLKAMTASGSREIGSIGLVNELVFMEKNIFWNFSFPTGARMLYRYLPHNAGLRKITLHKCEIIIRLNFPFWKIFSSCRKDRRQDVLVDMWMRGPAQGPVSCRLLGPRDASEAVWIHRDLSADPNLLGTFVSTNTFSKFIKFFF